MAVKHGLLQQRVLYFNKENIWPEEIVVRIGGHDMGVNELCNFVRTLT
jgi:hypothetical protein